MDNIEEVEKILGMAITADLVDGRIGTEIYAQQICQLFPPYQDALWSDKEGQCFWCEKLTHWLDICYEGYVCSAKCQQEIAQDVKARSRKEINNG